MSRGSSATFRRPKMSRSLSACLAWMPPRPPVEKKRSTPLCRKVRIATLVVVTHSVTPYKSHNNAWSGRARSLVQTRTPRAAAHASVGQMTHRIRATSTLFCSVLYWGGLGYECDALASAEEEVGNRAIQPTVTIGWPPVTTFRVPQGWSIRHSIAQRLRDGERPEEVQLFLERPVSEE